MEAKDQATEDKAEKFQYNNIHSKNFHSEDQRLTLRCSQIMYFESIFLL